jgi:hypothetical protein
MKFTVKHQFKAKARTWEVGNIHNTDNFPEIDESDVERWYKAGFVDIEGREAGPEPSPNRVVVEAVSGARHSASSTTP